ncbi:MAG: T9SS type A sorting domain-containing protein [Bacteroidia bacterium]
MKRFFTLCFSVFFITGSLFSAIVRKDFNITMNQQPQNQQIEFDAWMSSLFVVDYFANGSLSFAGKNTNEFQSTICVKSIGSSNYSPINIYNNSSVKNAGSEWRSTPVFLVQPSLTFENEFTGKGNRYLAAKLLLKQTGDVLYFWFLVNLSNDGKTFKIIKAAYNDEPGEDLFTENEGSTNPSTSINKINIPDLNVYPNPASSNVFVSLNGTFSYSILTLEGKNALNGYGFNKTNISVAHLPKGIYLLTVNSTDAVLTKRIVIE